MYKSVKVSVSIFSSSQYSPGRPILILHIPECCRNVNASSLEDLFHSQHFLVYTASIRKSTVLYASDLSISGYRGNKLSSVNTLHEHKLCSRSLNSEQSFILVYCVYSLSNESILMWICELWYICTMETICN
jgi:hypothetical protein